MRRLALAAPGSERQLFDLAATIAMTPFDRARPPWEAMLIEELEGGRAGYVLKLHHAVSDGLGIMQLLNRFLQKTRDGQPRPQPAPRDPWGKRPPGVTTLTTRVFRSKLLALPAQAASLIGGAGRAASRLAADKDEMRALLDYADSAKRMLGTAAHCRLQVAIQNGS